MSGRAEIYVFAVKQDVHGAVVHAVDRPDLLHERPHAVAAVFGQPAERTVGASLAVLAQHFPGVKVQKPQVFYLHYPTQGFVASSTTSTMKRRNYQRESKLDEEYGEVEPCIKPMTKRKKNAKRTVKTS